MNRNTANAWITYSEMSVRPALRLFCFPYAGGNAAVFNSWSTSLPIRVQVCGVELPGRRRRFAEPPPNSMPQLIRDLTHVLREYVDLPYAIFGISFGALIGFEVAREMHKLGHPPMHLFVANCRAPHLPDFDPPIHALPEPDLITRLQCSGGTPGMIIEHAELMKLMLPTLRADFKLAETYKYVPKPPVAFPITAFLGSEDPTLTFGHLSPWRVHTHGPYKLQVLPGGHYFVDAARDSLLDAISSELTYYLNPRASAGLI